jgi:hypothetical protein
MAIKNGDVVKDKITGLQGVVVSTHDYMYGCRRFSVQPMQLHEGKPVEPSSFDEPQLDLIAEGGMPAKTGLEPGGPRNDPHHSR